MSQRLEDTDFQLSRGGMYFAAIVVIFPVAAFFLMISYAYINQLMEEFTLQRAGEYAGLLLFLFSLFGIILHAVTIPARQRFTEGGLSTPTWRGRRTYRWDTVTEAFVIQGKGGTILSMNTSNGRFTITLDAFKRQRSLYNEIARRIPVQIGIHDHTNNALQDKP